MKKLLLFGVILISANLQAQTYHWTVNHAANSGYVESNGRQIYAVDSNSLYVVGEYIGTVDLDPSANVDMHTSSGSEDIFVQKYNTIGTVVWTRVLDGTGRDAASEILVTENGELYISGTFYENIDLDPGVGMANFSFTGASPYEAIGFGQSLFLLKLDTAGNHLWSYGYGNGASFGGSRAVVNDQDGNIYTVATVHQRTGGLSSFDMDPTAGTDIIPCVGRTGILQKFDSNGDYLWGKRFFPILGTGTCDIEHATSDLNSNIIMAGYFNETIDFDPNSGTDTITGAGDFNIFIHKLDSSGSHQWVKAIQSQQGSGSLNYIQKLATDAAGNVYAVGYLREPLDMDPGVGTFILTPNAFSNAFLLKLDDNGDFMYAKMWGDTTSTGLGDVFIDEVSGNVLVSGYFYGNMDADPGAGVVNVISNNASDIFLAELDVNGDLVWSYTAGGTGYDNASSVFRTSDGATYLSGGWKDTVDFNPSGSGGTHISVGTSYNTFITKFGKSSVGVKETISLPSILIYPNPAVNYINITGINNKDVIELIDIQGRSVSSLISKGNTELLNIENYKAGNYYVKISSNTHSFISKVVIQ
jgi:hypothetical protein